MNLVATLRKAIETHGLIPEGATVVVGVSGGADSVALLHAFSALDIPVTVAHLNHQLRGEASDADEQFVRGLGFPVVVKSVDIRALAERAGCSVEMAARQARHDFFATFADSVIALAHHADDQAETFILKLARGAGSEGLGGMSFRQKIGPLHLIRPMLGIPRAEILHWLEANGFEWREDQSNFDEAFLRNRVRHTVLPLLEKEMNPNIRETILRTMDILRAENEFIEAASCLVPAGATQLDATATMHLPLALQRRAVRKWLFEQGVQEVGFDVVEKVLVLMRTAEGSTIFELNHQQRVVVEYGLPRFEDSGEVRLEQKDPTWALRIQRGTGWKKDHGKGAGILPAEASFDASKVGDSLITVRSFEPGDRMRPFGMKGSRKLQDIFTDQKIPRAQRLRVPVVICRNEIIWIPGYRTAYNWAVQGADGSAIHVGLS